MDQHIEYFLCIKFIVEDMVLIKGHINKGLEDGEQDNMSWDQVR